MGDEFKPTAPDYAGDGFSIWKAVDKNGKTFLKLKNKMFKDITFNCFKLETKEKKEEI